MYTQTYGMRMGDSRKYQYPTMVAWSFELPLPLVIRNSKMLYPHALQIPNRWLHPAKFFPEPLEF